MNYSGLNYYQYLCNICFSVFIIASPLIFFGP